MAQQIPNALLLPLHLLSLSGAAQGDAGDLLSPSPFCSMGGPLLDELLSSPCLLSLLAPLKRISSSACSPSLQRGALLLPILGLSPQTLLRLLKPPAASSPPLRLPELSASGGLLNRSGEFPHPKTGASGEFPHPEPSPSPCSRGKDELEIAEKLSGMLGSLFRRSPILQGIRRLRALLEH